MTKIKEDIIKDIKEYQREYAYGKPSMDKSVFFAIEGLVRKIVFKYHLEKEYGYLPPCSHGDVFKTKE